MIMNRDDYKLYMERTVSLEYLKILTDTDLKIILFGSSK